MITYESCALIDSQSRVHRKLRVCIFCVESNSVAQYTVIVFRDEFAAKKSFCSRILNTIGVKQKKCNSISVVH